MISVRQSIWVDEGMEKGAPFGSRMHGQDNRDITRWLRRHGIHEQVTWKGYVMHEEECVTDRRIGVNQNSVAMTYAAMCAQAPNAPALPCLQWHGRSSHLQQLVLLYV